MSAKKKKGNSPERLAADEERKLERAKVTKKLRFEIFKRDSFTCQYCGESAPNVVLHADHIKPVSKGGKTDMVNMVTSCAGCNGGKGARELSDDSAVSVQQKQLVELQEKRLQLDMMLEWRGAIQEIESGTIDAAISAIDGRIEPYSVSGAGRETIGDLIKNHGLPHVFDAIDKAASIYLKNNDEGVITSDSAELMFAKLGGVCRHIGKSDFEIRKHYVKGICKNRFLYFDESKYWVYMDVCSRAAVEITNIERIAKVANSWPEFLESLEDLSHG